MLKSVNLPGVAGGGRGKLGGGTGGAGGAGGGMLGTGGAGGGGGGRDVFRDDAVLFCCSVLLFGTLTSTSEMVFFYIIH